MLSENGVVVNMDDVHYVFGIVLSQILEDLQFDTGLIIILFFILNYFYGYVFLFFVVNASQGCAKRALTEEFYDLISECYMVTHDDLVVTFIIIITIVVIVLFHLSLATAVT